MVIGSANANFFILLDLNLSEPWEGLLYCFEQDLEPCVGLKALKVA